MRSAGIRGSAPVLVIIALAALFAFLGWLYTVSTADVEEIPVELEEAEPDVLVLADLAGQSGTLVGKSAKIDGAEVDRGLGRGVFVVRVGEGTYPVLLSADLIAQGISPGDGDRVNLKGTVYTLNDSIRSAWVEQGAIESVTGISAAESFLLADSATITN